MISINTNLSAGILNRSLNNATLNINKTIERLTTGFKINHASDNAAGYAIATSCSSKLSSYNIASDNIAGGLDMLATAQDTIEIMERLGTRLHALVTQARNGTYGETSLEAINEEATAIIAEIDRIYNNAEYNGIKLFTANGESSVQGLPDWVNDLNNQLDTSRYSGFISNAKTKSDSYVSTLQHVSELSDFESGKEYQISTKEDLTKLAQLVNSNKDTTNVTFYLGADIDLNGATWTPIANKANNSSYQFKGTFDGNGHLIKNFKINSGTKSYQGLFGYTAGSATIKNLGVENADVTGRDFSAILVGSSDGTVTNCYANGKVSGHDRVGAIAGNAAKEITYSYSNAEVSGNKYVGGLVGSTSKAINNCFTNGSVTSEVDYCGGLTGSTDGIVEYCYSNATVIGQTYTSGLVGRTTEAVRNSYATGNVTGNDFVGGVVGNVKKATGSMVIDKILSLGTVTTTGAKAAGALIGGLQNTSNGGRTYSNISITNGYVKEQELPKIGGTYTTESGNAPVPYDMTEWLNNISYVDDIKPIKDDLSFQVGIYGDINSKIKINTGLSYDLSALLINGLQSEHAYDTVNRFLQTIDDKATMLGAASNRLESALDCVHTDIMNLTSSLSTIKDTDIATTSSKYIQQQILQQASATLFATANQAPSIALQLI